MKCLIKYQTDKINYHLIKSKLYKKISSCFKPQLLVVKDLIIVKLLYLF